MIYSRQLPAPGIELDTLNPESKPITTELFVPTTIELGLLLFAENCFSKQKS